MKKAAVALPMMAKACEPPRASQSSAPIRVTVVEDDGEYAESLSVVIGNAPGFTCSGWHRSAELALKTIDTEKPDVVLLDLNLPGLSGSDCVRKLKARMPKTLILVLTVQDQDKEILKVLAAGADGYLEKPVTFTRILDALKDLHEGGAPMTSHVARLVLKSFHQRGRSMDELKNLTSREEEVLALLAQGCSYKEIGDQLGIKVQTVNSHLKITYRKLHVRNGVEAAAKFLGR